MAQTVQPRIFGVREINQYLREYLAEDDFLSQIAIRGELSSFVRHSSGHIYCSLKDQDCKIKTVMFRRFSEQLDWQPSEGDQVVVFGRIALYEKDGTCQLYAEQMLAAGEGYQSIAMEQLKARLEQEGVFAPERKKQLPAYAFSIAVITSAEGAAWADIQRVAFSRNPLVKLLLYPAAVQGESAANELAAALEKADSNHHDLLLIGRGGGANEDLGAFDQEIVIRAIAKTTTPIIAAIGHESDFTLSDLAADASAATPSHAAMIAIKELGEIKNIIETIFSSINTVFSRKLVKLQQDLALLNIEDKADKIIQRCNNQLAVAVSRLEALSPLAILKRGYALAYTASGELIHSANQLVLGEKISVYPQTGRIKAVVEEIDNE